MDGPCSGTMRSTLAGLSLVELMVAMLLGIILSGGMVAAYLSAKRNFHFDEQAARIQENGRYAIRLLTRELSMVGFFAGLTVQDDIPPVAVSVDCGSVPWALDATRPLELVDAHDGQAQIVTLHGTLLDCLEGETIVPGSDILSIKRTAASASLRRGVPAADLTPSLVERWYLRVESGYRARWEKRQAVSLLDPALAQAGLSYWEAVSRIYFVRRTSETGEGDDRVPTLCMKTLAGNQMTSRCLVEGVEDVQYEFGVDTDDDGTPNRYTTAPAGAELDRVVSVRLYLLLRSVQPLPGYRDEKTYSLGRKRVPAPRDAYLRSVYSSTVLLRNHSEPVG